MSFSNEIIDSQKEQFKEFTDIFNSLEFGCSKYKERLQKKDDYLDAILYGITNIILLQNSEGDLLYVNRQFYKYFPEYKNIIGFKKRHNSISELFDSDNKEYIDRDYFIDNFNDILVNEREHKVKITRNNKIIFFNLTISKSELNKKYFIIILTDITKLERETQKNILQERILQQQAKMASMGEMIGNIAHQWRQPLNALSVINVLLHKKYEIGKLSKNDMDSFKKKSDEIIKKMNSTIDDFRNFFAPKHKLKQWFSIQEAINSTISFMGNPYLKNRINLTDRSQQEITLLSYRGELEQVFLNIIKNSKDAIKGQDRQLVITIDIVEVEDMIKIEISDNAGGIKKEIIDRVCEPYFTTKFESQGTGIGLYMSKIIIEKSLKGSLKLENKGDGVVTTIKIKREV